MSRKKEHNSIEEARDTGLGLVLLALVIFWVHRDARLVAVAMLLLLASVLRPQLFRPLAGPWLRLCESLGKVSSAIVLGTLFFLVITPVGLVRRVFGADPLQKRRWRDGSASVFKDSTHTFRADDLDRPF